MGNRIKFFCAGFCLPLCLLTHTVWSAEHPPGLEPELTNATLPGADVEGLLDLARHQNLELAAVRLEADAAAERVNAAGTLPDPMFRTELRDITHQGTRSPSLLPDRVGSTYYQITQTLPVWGKRGLQRDVANAEAEQARGQISLTWADLSARIKSGFAQHYLLAHSEKLTEEILELVNTLEQIARSRYASGLSAQQDAIRAQVEQTRLRRELVMLKLEYHHAMTRINTLLLRPPHAATGFQSL